MRAQPEELRRPVAPQLSRHGARRSRQWPALEPPLSLLRLGLACASVSIASASWTDF